MALVFNGSTNTITGLAVGGLPDGTVDADTLAAGAGKGSGRIIKTASYNNTGRTTISGTSWTACGSVAITPTAATSTMLVLVSFPFAVDSNNASVTYVRPKFRLMWNHSGISETQLQHKRFGMALPESSGEDMIIHDTCEIMYLHDHNTANEITYEIQGACAEATAGLEVTEGGGTDNKTIEVLEIGA